MKWLHSLSIVVVGSLFVTAFSREASAQDAKSSRPVVAVQSVGIPAAEEGSRKASPTVRSTLTGDWGGARTRLADRGFIFRADYVSETFSVLTGGRSKNGTAYAQQVRVGFDLDMERVAGIKGGTFHFTVNDRAGRGVSSAYIGNRLPVQETYGGQFSRLTEASYEQDLANGAVNLRAGYFAMGNDLGGVSAGCNFVNAAFCAHPLSLSGDSDWSNYPNARWGVALRIKARDDLRIRTGLFQVNPELGDEDNAFNPFGGTTTGKIIPLEIEYAPGHDANDHRLPASYKFGMYYDTADAPRAGEAGQVDGRYGVYAEMTQTLLRHGDGPRNLVLIGAFTRNPRTSAQISDWAMLGLVKTGTFVSRDTDTMGVGLVRATVNPRLRDSHRESLGVAGMDASLPSGETAVELSYGIQIRQWLLVRPDIQFILEPGAFTYESRKHAVAAGLQVKVQF